ncbi:protein of unknown function [Enterobacter cancerogenus]|nr:protein of unknown function [Enterobacter cancerogenus]
MFNFASYARRISEKSNKTILTREIGVIQRTQNREPCRFTSKGLVLTDDQFCSILQRGA